jgi:hypothetical protein
LRRRGVPLRALEWHVVLSKSFQDIAFDLVPRLHHAIILLLSAFSLPRFKAIGSIGNVVGSNGIE